MKKAEIINAEPASSSILANFPSLTGNHQNIIDSIADTGLGELANHLQSDPGFVLCYQQRLLDPSVTLIEFGQLLDRAAANNERSYAVYAGLYQMKQFCLEKNNRKKLLDRFGEYTDAIDNDALGYMNQLIRHLVASLPKQDELMTAYKAREASSTPNEAWRPRDEALDILRTKAEDTYRQSIATASTTQRGINERMPNASLQEYRALDTAHYYSAPEKYSIPNCYNLSLEMLIQTNADDSADVGTVSFYSTVFAKNPTKIAEWVAGIKLETYRARDSLFHALWQANIPAAHNLLNTFPSQYKKEIALVKKRPIIDLKSAPLNSAAMLDRLWAAFFASGEPIYIKRLLSKACGVGFEDLQVQQRVPVSELMEKGIVYAAKWSMQSNLKQHPAILAIAIESIKHLSRNDKQAVLTLIDGAQGLRSAMATFGMTFFDNQYSDFSLSQIKLELQRLTGLTFNQKLSADSATLQCWIKLEDEPQAQKIVDFLTKNDVAKSVALRHTSDGHKPLILIEQPKLSALQNCKIPDSVVDNKLEQKR